MKKTIEFLFAISLLLYFGCKDDLMQVPESENISPNSILAKNNINPSYNMENDMLEFNDMEHYYNFVDFLHQESRNQENINNAYLEIGFSYEDMDGGLNYTNHPTCKLFENQIGFTSIRTLEEINLFKELEAGNDEISPIIDRPYLKTILNKYNSVKIGDRILRFYDNELLAIIANTDFDTYHKIKELNSNEIQEGFNVRLSSTSTDELKKYYTIENARVSESIITEDLRIAQTNINEQSITIENHSFIEGTVNAEGSYKWIYPDGYSSEGIHPTRDIEEEDEVCLRYKDHKQTNLEECTIAVRCTLIIHCVNLGDGVFSFWATGNATGNPPYYTNVLWNFGDGSATVTGSQVQHTFTGSGPFTVTASLLLEGGFVYCSNQKEVILDHVDCEDLGGKDDDRQVYAIDGEEYRLTGEIWIDTNWFNPNKMGAETFIQRKKWWGGWERERVDNIQTCLDGNFQDIDDNDECYITSIDVCVLFAEDGDYYISTWDVGDNEDDNFDITDPSKKPSELHSKHSFKLDGTWYEYTKNNGMIVLQ